MKRTAPKRALAVLLVAGTAAAATVAGLVVVLRARRPALDLAADFALLSSKSADREAVRAAAERLVAARDPAAIPHLARTLEGDAGFVAAALRWAEEGRLNFVERLEEWRKSEDGWGLWASELARALGPEARPAVPELVRLVEGESFESFVAALDALAAIGPHASEAAPALVRALRRSGFEGSPGISQRGGRAAWVARPLVKHALGEILWEREGALREIFDAVPDWGVVETRALGDALWSPSSGFDRVRRSRWSTEKATAELAPLLEHPRAVVRLAALQLFGRAQTILPSIDSIARLLVDPEPRIRFEALDALRAGSDPRAGPLLLRALEDEDARVRARAAELLSRLSPPPAGAVSALVRLLDDPKPEVASDAAHALSRVGAEAAPALPALRSLLERAPDDERATSCAAIEAILEIDPQDPSLLGLLLPLLESGSPHRDAALAYLWRLGPRAAPAVPQLVALLQGGAVGEVEVEDALRALAAVGPPRSRGAARDRAHPRAADRCGARRGLLSPLGRSARARGDRPRWTRARVGSRPRSARFLRPRGRSSSRGRGGPRGPPLGWRRGPRVPRWSGPRGQGAVAVRRLAARAAARSSAGR